jgi:hypothetical protein
MAFRDVKGVEQIVKWHINVTFIMDEKRVEISRDLVHFEDIVFGYYFLENGVYDREFGPDFHYGMTISGENGDILFTKETKGPEMSDQKCIEEFVAHVPRSCIGTTPLCTVWAIENGERVEKSFGLQLSTDGDNPRGDGTKFAREAPNIMTYEPMDHSLATASANSKGAYYPTDEEWAAHQQWMPATPLDRPVDPNADKDLGDAGELGE